MSLLRIREERKELGGAVKKGPRTFILFILLGLVIVLITYLDRFS